MRRYNPKEIEPKWQKVWEESKIYQASDDLTKPKKYVLEYFPYPSGAAMHVGHVRNYTIGDAVARFSRMRGYNVLHPMGWDAFGLPAENYAIKNHVSPKVAIEQNTTKFRQQLTQMGFSYDWSREINSTDPDYYKWTQWFFLMLYKKGLAYQKEALVNWDPIDKTVLANEQVIDGRADRSGAVVEKKALKQWFFKITDYADRLLGDLDDLNWSDAIKTMQRNWIGRSTGAEVNFKVDNIDETIIVFTTRPDTLFGATFMVLAPEHGLVNGITTEGQRQTVEEYIKQSQTKSDIERQETDREKSGVFTGAYAINPVNQEKIPIWIADYVLTGYGTGAIMAVPAHDERDREFAIKFDLPIRHVIAPTFGDVRDEEVKKRAVISVVVNPKDDTVIVLDWGERKERYGGKMLIGGTMHDDEDAESTARREIAEETGYTDLKLVAASEVPGFGHFYSNTKGHNVFVEATGLFFELGSEEKQEVNLDEGEKGKFKVTWQPKSSVASMLDDGIHAYYFKSLVLGESFHDEGIVINSGKYNGLSSSDMREKIVADLAQNKLAEEKINYRIRDWLISRQRYWGAPIPIIHCPQDGIVPVPEEQLPVVLPDVESYEPSGDGRSPLANVPDFVNTTCPKCGGAAQRETDTMDGFACSSWYFLRFADPHNNEAPFARDKADFWLPVDDYIGGAEHAVMHLLYARFWTKVMFDEGLINFEEPFLKLRNQGMILAPDGQKMSKSKGNTIEPDGLIEQGYGADATRIMELFIGPWNQSAAWSVEGMGGSFRFLQRAWTLVQEFKEASDEARQENNEELLRTTNRTIEKVSRDLEDLGFNTAIAALMELVNNLYKIKVADTFQAKKDWKFALLTLTQLLAPFAPHIAEELWQELGQDGSVHISEWPVHDPKYLVSDTFTIAVQVNGKLRATLELSSDSDESAVIAAVKNHEKIKPYLENAGIKKTIYVPSKLVNMVIS